MRHCIVFILIMLSALHTVDGQLTFASMFTDNMVLQQDTMVKIWGSAEPGERVVVRCSWQHEELASITNQKGVWSVSVKTLKAGFEEYEISVTDPESDVRKIQNIVFGEVWLCSGQSNMEMILMNQPAWNLIVQGSEEAIADAGNRYLRVLTVGRKESFSPLTGITTAGWKMSDPENAKWFSAAAYFFGRKLSMELKVPVGLIVSAYGGSPIQSWIPEEILLKKDIYGKVIDDKKREAAASQQSEAEYCKAVAEWIAENEKRGTKETTTASLTLPLNMEKSSLGNQMGEFALTRTIDIGDEAGSSDIHISLGTMDDLGRVYFNGELVWEEIKNSGSYSKIRFTVPAEKVKKGSNIIEARVLNVLWGGGLTGPSEEMYYQAEGGNVRRSLAGVWQYHKIFDMEGSPAMPPEGKPLFSTAASLYNGMIYPVREFCIKGVLWYQGESNVSEAGSYTTMMSDMISSWRDSFGSCLPFYFVQIAPYQYGDYYGSEAALLREAQSRVEETADRTAMIVTMDIGDPTNIHPAHKREVGERLALKALTDTYNRQYDSNYPRAEKIVCRRGCLKIYFSGSYDRLTATAGTPEFELSADGENYKRGTAKISGSTITVCCDEIERPRYARYCWRDGAAGTVVNSAGLPLSSFRAEADKKKKAKKN